MSTVMAEKKTTKYQWIKSERIGDVVEVAENQPDAKWLHFTDGSRINPSILGEYMTEVAHDNQIMNFPDLNIPQTDVIQPETPAVNTNTTSQSVSSQTPAPSPMAAMIVKMSKKNLVEVPVAININIPTPELYAMLAANMEDEDLKDEIMGVALAQIEINKLQEYIKEQIINFLNTYYG
jgi:hypothetical protein